jgi:hypothetical protein
MLELWRWHLELGVPYQGDFVNGNGLGSQRCGRLCGTGGWEQRQLVSFPTLSTASGSHGLPPCAC